MLISDWSSDVCSSDLLPQPRLHCKARRAPDFQHATQFSRPEVAAGHGPVYRRGGPRLSLEPRHLQAREINAGQKIEVQRLPVARIELDEVEAAVTVPHAVFEHGCALPSQVAQASHGVLHQAWIVPGSPEAHGAAARRLEVTGDKADDGKNLAARANQQGEAGLAPG